MKPIVAVFFSAIVVLAGCSTTTQLTSGADYLDRYPQASEPAAVVEGDLNAQVRAIAAVEPDLRFPARIGLARIENNQLTTVPADELALWGELAEELGSEIGDWIPVSPLIAASVRPAQGSQDRGYSRRDPAAVLADIRRGAARQHLDYVLIYELTGGMVSQGNALEFVPILGYFVLPSREMKIHGAGNALLLDVRNGYPYGTAGTFVEERELTRGVGHWQRGREQTEAAKLTAVEELSGEVEDMINQLVRQLVADANVQTPAIQQ